LRVYASKSVLPAPLEGPAHVEVRVGTGQEEDAALAGAQEEVEVVVRIATVKATVRLNKIPSQSKTDSEPEEEPSWESPILPDR
jgi:hypothetical protein